MKWMGRGPVPQTRSPGPPSEASASRRQCSQGGSVTVWGLDDGTSWLNGFPVRGRTNHPLLFDRQLKAKPCYDALVKLKQPQGLRK